MKRFIDLAIEKIIKENCPRNVFHTSKYAPLKDCATQVIDTNEIIGCRGITCKECWEKEVIE